MLTIGSLFTGYGGLDLAVETVLDARTVWTSDVDPGARRIIGHRWPDAPNLGDITAVDWLTVDPVDAITGGFPCQDVSHAGARRGLGPGTRSGLWARMADAIDHLRPALVVAENVRGLLSAAADSDVEPCPWCVGGTGDGEPPLRALGSVLADLADLGYDAAWHGVRASDVGAPHGRFRVFVLAWPAADTGGERRDRWPGLDRPRGAAAVRVEAGDHPRDAGGASSAADTDGAARGQRRVTAPGQAEGRRARPDAGGRSRAPAPDAGAAGAGRDGRAVPGAAARSGRPAVNVHAPRDARRDPAANADGDGLEGVGRVDTVGRDAHGRGRADIAWGPYEPAVRRWERALDRSAPAPTEPGRTGAQRLAPPFVEWMMGLPDGWVTAVPGLSRNEQLKALGNGVVPQQAAAALTTLLAWRTATS